MFRIIHLIRINDKRGNKESFTIWDVTMHGFGFNAAASVLFICLPFILNAQDSVRTLRAPKQIIIRNENVNSYTPGNTSQLTESEKEKRDSSDSVTIPYTPEQQSRNKENDLSVITDTTVDTVKKYENTVEEESDLFLVDEEEELFITDDKEEMIIKENSAELKDTKTSETTLINTEENESQTSDSLVTEITEEPLTVTGEYEEEGEEDQSIVEKPAVIEKTRSVNFAKNLKEYRSPRRAMIMSLLVPGLGQAYARRNWKIALFAVIEAGIVGGAIKFNLDGKEKMEEARDFADLHFKMDNLVAHYGRLQEFLVSSNGLNKTPEQADSIITQAIFYGESIESIKAKYGFAAGQPWSPPGHESSLRQDFDEEIEDASFVFGWDDAEPYMDKEKGVVGESPTYKYSYTVADTLTPWIVIQKDKVTGVPVDGHQIYGYSQNQKTYMKMVGRSNRYFNYAKNMVFVLLVNHVASAVDAFITARAYNEMLLNREESFWQRINIEQNYAYTNDGFSSEIGVKVRF